MHTYKHNDTQNRVIFNVRDVLLMRPMLEKCQNSHEAFRKIEAKFVSEQSVNISEKQVEVLDRTFRFAGLPSVSQVCAGNPYDSNVVFRGTKATAMQRVLGHFDCGNYGDWTHSDDILNVYSPSFKLMEVTCSDGLYYLSFAHPMDLSTAEIALDQGVMM